MRALNAAAVAALMLFLLCGSAQTQSIANPIDGTWILQSLYEENDSGEELDRWGDKSAGSFIADASGYFSLQLIGRGAIHVGAATSSPTSCLLRQWPGDLARSLDEELCDRAQCAVLQGNDADRCGGYR